MAASVAGTKPRLRSNETGFQAPRKARPGAIPPKFLGFLLALAVLATQPGAHGDKKEAAKVPATVVANRHGKKPAAKDASTPGQALTPIQAAEGQHGPGLADTFPQVVLTLPAGSKLRVRCLIPPQPNEVAQKFSANLQFAVDADGTPWIGYDWDTFLNPAKRLRLKVPVRYSWMVCTSRGALLLATETDYGFLLPPTQPGESKDSPQAVYQPVANLPARGSRVVAGAGDCLYFIASRADGGSDVYVQAPKQLGFSGFARVFTSEARVTAVAGDGKTTFVALGGLVVKVAPPDGAVSKVYSAHHREIRQLAWLPGTGLLYNTGQAIGFIGEKGAAYVLASAPDAQIVLHGDVLYVLQEDTLGIFTIENLGDLQRFDAPVQEVPLSDLGVEVRSVRLFKASEELGQLPPVETLDFADRYDRQADAKAYLYCLVDIANLRTGEAGRSHLLNVVFRNLDTKRLEWQHTQTVRMEPDWPGVWVWPCVGQIGGIYPGEYRAETYLDGALVNETRFSVTGRVSLLWAVARDDLERAREALAAGDDVNATDKHGETPLILAAGLASPQMVRLLLDAGADPNAYDSGGRTVLMRAVRSGNVDKVRHLLDAGADVKKRGRNGGTVLHELAWAVHFYPQHFAPSPQEKAGALVKLLVTRGGDINARDKDGYTPLQLAIFHNCPDLVQVFADNGADVNATDDRGFTPLDTVLLLVRPAQSGSQDFLSLQRVAAILQSRGAEVSYYRGRYFPGMEELLSPDNLLLVLAGSENAARAFEPGDPGLRRVSVAAFLKLAQQRASAGDVEKAIFLCQEAAQRARRWGMKPEYAEAVFDEALLWLAQGDAARARPLLEECTKAAPKGQVGRQARDLLGRLQKR